MYINEVERLDGFGQEIFPVKVCQCIYSGTSESNDAELCSNLWCACKSCLSKRDRTCLNAPEGEMTAGSLNGHCNMRVTWAYSDCCFSSMKILATEELLLGIRDTPLFFFHVLSMGVQLGQMNLSSGHL